jgi:hypothetical protein
MRPIAYAFPTLPGLAGPKTFAAWPVWHDSTTAAVKFRPLSKKDAAKWRHKARRFDRQTHTRGIWAECAKLRVKKARDDLQAEPSGPAH